MLVFLNFLVYDFLRYAGELLILLVGSLRTSVFSFFFPSFVFFSLTFTDTFFTLDVYLGHGDAVRVVDPELGKLERENIGHDLQPHGISLNTPILGTTSTSARRHTRRESNPGTMMNNACVEFLETHLSGISLSDEFRFQGKA